MGNIAISPLLRETLAPLSAHYDDPATVEIRMTKPGIVITDRRGTGKQAVRDEGLTLAAVEAVARSLGNYHGLGFNGEDRPKLSCVLPGGHRFECLVGPSVQSGLSLAIRCKHPFTPSWDQVGASEAVVRYLTDAVDGERNLIVSGATNTGKTTLLNMLLAGLPDHRRVIGVEDTPELSLGRFWDGVGLIAAREEGGSHATGLQTWRQLYDHLMRATPDHIVFGEISTQNAFAALAALNSGVTGFMCTIHAESPHQAIHRKFDQNIAWSGETMPRVPEFLSELVDVVVQIKRDSSGFRRITDIYEPRADRFVLKDGKETGA
ncbi:Flp pilus assembly complex ATPase component TadA [Rhodospirillaceae bacterium KN72]|uniref:Flp pilus assembly complex ATPase component TadA n=1 Tax=Pacificispira spongiicola TaxID=2729598 RepID=A0A7Y0DYH9_9PROT|nr:ATPase, T2SS/T4P/T4SS family [Pacificispira spongiicola]NMM43920.1 Flp pilus assembly complex ATPase component TadA [Pacificispira spongiicola]